MDEDNIIFVPVDTAKDSIPYARIKKPETSVKQPIPGWYSDVFHELVDKCDPENFMNPYDPVKVGKANELYALILANENNKEELLNLRLRAIKELGIKISTQRLYDELLVVCNPKQFTGAAYNEVLLALANQVYPSIRQNADNIFALESIRKQVEELYVWHVKEKEKAEKKDKQYIKNGTIWILLFSALLILLVIIIICLKTLLIE